MTRSNTLAVARVKCGARDRRNRAIAKRLVGGASTRAVGAEFGMTAKHIARIRMQLTGAPPPCLCPLARQSRRKIAAVMAQGSEHSGDWMAAWRVKKRGCRQDRPAGAPAAQRQASGTQAAACRSAALLGRHARRQAAQTLGHRVQRGDRPQARRFQGCNLPPGPPTRIAAATARYIRSFMTRILTYAHRA
jgi:hypothetical protein